MVLMGVGGERAQETSLSPMGCEGERLLRVPTFRDCTRQACSRAEVGGGAIVPMRAQLRGVWLN